LMPREGEPKLNHTLWWVRIPLLFLTFNTQLQ
jgi:hypothetical protein